MDPKQIALVKPRFLDAARRRTIGDGECEPGRAPWQRAFTKLDVTNRSELGGVLDRTS